jgi:hypothetical protein
MRDVEAFANEFGMAEILPELRKGALVAQNPDAFETIEGLDEADRQALRDEATHKWRQPRTLWFAIIVCSMGAMVQGWDQVSTKIVSPCNYLHFRRLVPTEPIFPSHRYLGSEERALMIDGFSGC